MLAIWTGNESIFVPEIFLIDIRKDMILFDSNEMASQTLGQNLD